MEAETQDPRAEVRQTLCLKQDISTGWGGGGGAGLDGLRCSSRKATTELQYRS